MKSIVETKVIDKIDIAIKLLESFKDNKLMETNNIVATMLPIAYSIAMRMYPMDDMYDEEIYEIVKEISSITNANEISILGCYIFVRYTIEIIEGKYKELSYEYIKTLDYSFFDDEIIKKYDKILKGDIKTEKIEDIKSTGYIVDTLETILWLFLNSKDYNETILKAVNLGDDTDTIVAITGGLLGIHYGAEKIKESWKKDLKKKEDIEKMCDEFCKALIPQD